MLYYQGCFEITLVPTLRRGNAVQAIRVGYKDAIRAGLRSHSQAGK